MLFCCWLLPHVTLNKRPVAIKHSKSAPITPCFHNLIQCRGSKGVAYPTTQIAESADTDLLNQQGIKMAISADELLEYVGLVHDDLKTRCTDEDLKDMSLHIPSWERYAPFLKLTDADVEDISTKTTKPSHKMLLALQRWKQMFAFRATFEFLVKEVFLKNSDTENAEFVCQLLKSRMGKEIIVILPLGSYI